MTANLSTLIPSPCYNGLPDATLDVRMDEETGEAMIRERVLSPACEFLILPAERGDGVRLAMHPQVLDALARYPRSAADGRVLRAMEVSRACDQRGGRIVPDFLLTILRESIPAPFCLRVPADTLTLLHTLPEYAGVHAYIGATGTAFQRNAR